jgi:ankyrin repeat protein
LPLVKAFLAWPYLNPNANGPKGHSTALNEAITASWTYLPTTNVEMVQAILEHPNINPNLLAAEEMSRPLGTAIQHDDKAILEVLLARPDVNPNLSHGECSTFLTFAIETGNLEIVRRLLQRPDIDPNMRDKGLNHNTPLLAAVYSKRYDIIEELLKHTGLDPNGQSLEPSLGTALFYTAGKGREPVVKLLLTRPDIDVNLGNSNATPLANAILGDHIGTVELLLAHDKIDPNYAPKFPKTYTRLHSRPGQDKTFELKTSYAKKNKRYVRMIPLCLAAEGGHLQSSMMLLDHPTIDINVTDGTGRTALWWAVFRGLPDLVRLLLDRGAGAVINLKDVQGWTPLHVATNYSYPLPVDYLLEHPDVDPNAINQDGDAPLHLSIYSNNIDTVAKLLKHPKINKRLPMKGGVTPFQLAKKLGHQRILHELGPDTL